MSMPEDIVEEQEHRLKMLSRREARALARIRRALRSLADVRRKMATSRREHAAAVEALIRKKDER